MSGWNRRGLMQGQADSPGLTTAGRAQAEQAAASLVGCGATVLLSSDLRRARQTAGILSGALELPVLTETRLRERNLGTAEGRLSSPAMLETLGIVDDRVLDPHCSPTGGETVAQLYLRVTTLVAELCRMHPDTTVVLATHGGVIRVARHWAGAGGAGVSGAEAGPPGPGALDLAGMPWLEVANGSVWTWQWPTDPLS